MDELPFNQQRDKMTPLPGVLVESNSGGKDSKNKKSMLSNSKQPRFVNNNSTAIAAIDATTPAATKEGVINGELTNMAAVDMDD